MNRLGESVGAVGTVKESCLVMVGAKRIVGLQNRRKLMSCANSECDKDPFDSLFAQVVSTDGDMACDAECQAAHERQKAHFFNVTVHSEELTRKFLLGEDGDE